MIPKFHIDHNVYILGAGFSRDAGLPLLNDFLDKMREARVSLKGIESKESAIDNVLAFRMEASASNDKIRINLNNLEELLSLASALPNENGSTYLHGLPLAIGSTLNYCQNLYNKNPSKKWTIECPDSLLSTPSWEPLGYEDESTKPKKRRVPVYDVITGLMSGILDSSPDQQNTIITFNYDTLIEDALSRMGGKCTYGIPETVSGEIPKDWCLLEQNETDEKTLYLLKLHGSINWGVPKKDKKTHRTPKIFFRTFSELLESGNWPLIEPPTWKKGTNDILGNVWAKAVQRLKTATRIIVIGYSCPQTDPYFRFLLAAGLKDNISLTSIHIVNGNEDHKQKIKDLFSEHCVGLDRIQADAPTTLWFFSNQNFQENINRWPKSWTSPPG